MGQESKTKEECIEEIILLRKRIAELEARDAEHRRIESLLRASEERFHAFFERAPLGYQSLDENGCFIEVNQAWLDTLGYRHEEVIGRWFGEFLAPEYTEAFRERFPLFKSLGKIHSEFQMIHKNGARMFIAFEGRIGYKSDGTFQQTHCILSDITDRKRAEDALRSSERRFEQLLENSFDNIVVLDAEGVQRYVSKSVVRTLGYQPAELINISVIDQMIHPDDKERVRAAFCKIIVDGQGGGIQYRHRHKNGGWVYLEGWGTNQLNNPDVKGVVVNCHVITERKKAEDALLLAKENAEAASKAKSDFLNNIAHDFRTPMQAILGFSDFFQSERLTERQKKYANIINEKSKGLLALIEELLDVSRLESGRLELRVIPFDPRETVEEALEMIRPSIMDKGVELSCSIDKSILLLKGDAVRFSQVLVNLLSNAVKYTDKGEIVVRLDREDVADSKDKSRIRLSVKDTGLGISEDKQVQIFEAFTRFHEFSGGKERSGVGLGLYIVKTLVDLMKGKISLVSEVGVGTEFIVIFDFDIA